MIKKILLRVFFAGEIVIMIVCYLGGAHGLPTLMQLRREQVSLSADIVRLRNEVNELDHEIVVWKENSFYQEKFAREQLHMARPHDLIFYTSH